MQGSSRFWCLFKTFTGCGISSNTLLNYLFRCVYMSVCSNKQEETTMEHTSTIRNMIDKPKHLKYDFIHKIEEPATMKMPIWNAQQMAKKIDNRAATKCSNKRLQ
jgi:hypothetical protein